MSKDELQPPQHQDRQPGRESRMDPPPDYMPRFAGSGRLDGKVALITGGDSGIGRAVAVAMAREGASIAIVYLEEDSDADETLRAVEQEGSDAIKLAGDIGDAAFCREAVKRTVDEYVRLYILFNNATEQHQVAHLRALSARQHHRTLTTNVSRSSTLN